MAGPLAIRVYEKRSQLTSFQRRLLAASAVIAVTTLVFGKINELRIFVPSLTILAYVSASGPNALEPALVERRAADGR